MLTAGAMYCHLRICHRSGVAIHVSSGLAATGEKPVANTTQTKSLTKGSGQKRKKEKVWNFPYLPGTQPAKQRYGKKEYIFFVLQILNL